MFPQLLLLQYSRTRKDRLEEVVWSATSAPSPVKLSSMGRKKIKIEKIPNERHRWVTFNKRKAGLVRKATELAILCEAEVGVIVFSGQGTMSLYSNIPMDDLLTKFREYKETPEVRHADPECPGLLAE